MLLENFKELLPSFEKYSFIKAFLIDVSVSSKRQHPPRAVHGVLPLLSPRVQGFVPSELLGNYNNFLIVTSFAEDAAFVSVHVLDRPNLCTNVLFLNQDDFKTLRHTSKDCLVLLTLTKKLNWISALFKTYCLFCKTIFFSAPKFFS